MTQTRETSSVYHSRYADRQSDWSARLFGVAGSSSTAALVVLGSLMTWKAVTRPAFPPAPPLVVEFDYPSAPAAPSRDVPPGPLHQERPQDRAIAAAKPNPPLSIEVVHPSPAPMERPDQVQVVPPAQPVPLISAPQSFDAPASEKVADTSPIDWEAQILAHLERFRRYPARAQAAHREGIVHVRFTMDRSGTVLDMRVVRKSGSFDLDRAALETLKRAQPLPAIPRGRPDKVELTIPVAFYLR